MQENLIKSMTEKVCTKCRLPKPIDCYYSDRRASDGKKSECKECCALEAAAEYVRNRAKHLANWKTYYSRAKEHRKEHQHEYNKANAKRLNELSKQRYYANREAILARISRYQKDNREKRNEQLRNRRRNNPEKCRIEHQKRRARLRSATGSYTEQEWVKLCDSVGNVCVACGKPKKLTVDHIIPLSLGGANSIDNIQPLCFSCNASKSTKTIDYRALPVIPDSRNETETSNE